MKRSSSNRPRVRNPSPSSRRVIRLAVVGLALVLGAAACGDDDPTADAPSTTEADAPAEVDVVAADYEFQGLPDTVEAGTKLVLSNASTKEVHELVAVRLLDTETRSAAELAQLDVLDGAAVPGPPAAVLLAPPGAPAFAAVGDGTLSTPGRYLLICAIPTGADPEEFLAAAAEATDGPPQVEGGPPHFKGGMYAELTVTP